MDEKLALNEFEAMFYKFSPIGFTDQVHNAVLDSWCATVNELLNDPHISRFAHDKKFKQQLLEMLFKNSVGCFTKILDEFTTYTQSYIFRISPSVTLPQHFGLQRQLGEAMRNGRMYNPQSHDQKIKKLKEKLIEKRFIEHDLDNQIQDSKDVLEVMHTMDEELKKISASNA